MSMIPKLFVASSKEALRLAEAVQQNLEDYAEVTVWNQDAFQPGQNVVDELNRNLQRSHFGVFVFSPDDLVRIRGKNLRSVRDNVILELGMFIGRLGKERSFIITPKPPVVIQIPTDLLGVVTGQYDAGRTENPRAALGPACIQIKDAIKYQLRKLYTKLNGVVENSLETVCRAMSIPITPEQATLRAFIFRKEGDELVCRHFWDPNPSDENVGRTRFKINEATSSKVVVVKCYLENATQRSDPKFERGDVEDLPEGFLGVKGKIKPSLRYVLAAPIRSDDDTIWGVVGFDSSNDAGANILGTDLSIAVMMRLTKQLASLLA